MVQATLGSPSHRSSLGPRRAKSFCRKCERYCCTVLTYFPLSFVYGLTTWAIWVEVRMASLQASFGTLLAFLGIALYVLLNWSYTTAVFTDPGSPLMTPTTSHSHGYSSLPISEPSHTYPQPTTTTSVTVKASGEVRFCKKCQCKKPDRAHHCSSCKRCVLKMDHHCPWLATCVGLRNYKPFLLFLIYTTLFCWVCFGVSAAWIWQAIIIDQSIEESFMPVNYILLSVLSGIIGLVVGGFTAWHVHLTLKGKTTIESLESTRYLNPVKQTMAPHLDQARTYVDSEERTIGERLRNMGDQLIETHANALPGVLRNEEGEERMSPAQYSLRNTYDMAERQRERDRYMEYLDEQYNEKLPNAFDLGWRRNWRQVMGENAWLWFIPVINCMGDGWNWEVSEAWREASERVRERKEEEMRRSGLAVSMSGNGHAGQAPPMYNPNTPLPMRRPSPGGHERQWRAPEHRSGTSTPMRDLGERSGGEEDNYDTSSDEETLSDARARLLRQKQEGNWNDLPREMLGGRKSPRPPGRRKDR